MNKVLIKLLFLISIITSSCTTSKSVIAQNADLSKYKYASIINNDIYHIPAQLMEYEIQLFDAIENSRLKLVNEMRINELSSAQQSKLLLVKYGVDILENEESIVIVNFIDYLTGRPITSCRGTSTLGFSISSNIRSAIKRIAKQIEETFPKQ